MKYEILIPTHHRSDSEIISIIENINAKCDVLIVNQTNIDNTTIKQINDNRVKVVNVTNIGVSNNRNNLLKYATGDICICVDDDCPLVDNYLEIIENHFNKYPDTEAVLFNGIVTHENNRLVHTKPTKKVTKFNNVSYAGGPGLVFKREVIEKYNLSYNTNVGYPNKIQAGEDSLFIKSLVDKKVFFYRSKEVLFIIKDDVDNSSYFSGVSDDFVITKGYVTKLLHPRLTWAYRWHYAKKLRHWRGNTKRYLELIRLMKIGSKMAKKD